MFGAGRDGGAAGNSGAAETGPADPQLDPMGEAHVRDTHFPGGKDVDESKGVFNPDEDPYALAGQGAGTPVEGPNDDGFLKGKSMRAALLETCPNKREASQPLYTG